MTPTEELAAIETSLTLCADRAGDIVPAVFTRFFQRDDAAHDLMRHSDQHMQGRMFEGVLELLLSDDHFGPGRYLEWELDNHIQAYNATPSMYQSFFTALTDTVTEALGDDWSTDFQAAWDQRIARILQQVDAHPH